jgi:CBS domain-containing protein
MRKAVGATVGEVMSENPETCSDDATVEEVATALHEHDLSRLPVVRDGKLVGIVARGDILREIVKKGP